MDILGTTSATAIDAQEWAESKGAPFYWTSLLPFLYWRYAPATGVRPDVAFAQACKETNFGRFGGVIDKSYNNPCGMKVAAGGGNYDPEAHKRFQDWTFGVRAHLDHLALYAGQVEYPRSRTFDPRHFPSLWGIAKTVEGLGGKWAPSATYGEEIVSFVRDMTGEHMEIVPRAGWGAAPPKSRSLLPVNQLKGVTIHWFGIPRQASSHDGCPALLRSVQRGHMMNTEENYQDIAYNFAVCPHGVAYECRGFGVRSGANGSSEGNGTHGSVVYMSGKGDPNATEVAKRAINGLISEYRRRGAGIEVSPHKRWTGSECPGAHLIAWIAQGRPLLTAPIPDDKEDDVPPWFKEWFEWRLMDGKAATRPDSAPDAIPQKYLDLVTIAEKFRAAKPTDSAEVAALRSKVAAIKQIVG